MGHGPRYNVRDGGFARILCCIIKVNPMSVDLIKRREYDERVETLLALIEIAHKLSKTLSQDVGRGRLGHNQLTTTLFSLYYCRNRLKFLLNSTNRYDTK